KFSKLWMLNVSFDQASLTDEEKSNLLEAWNAFLKMISKVCDGLKFCDFEDIDDGQYSQPFLNAMPQLCSGLTTLSLSGGNDDSNNNNNNNASNKLISIEFVGQLKNLESFSIENLKLINSEYLLNVLDNCAQ